MSKQIVKMNPGTTGTVASSSSIIEIYDDQLRALKAMPDSAIDTSDISEVTDWSKSEQGKFYRTKE